MIATTRTHLSAVCHGRWARIALLGIGVAACAPNAGWQRDTARVCAKDSPAVICFNAVPDRGVVLEVGGATLVPGECARAPKDGGAVSVAWTNADGNRKAERIRAPNKRRTELALDAAGELQVIAKHACDPAMPPFEPLP